MISWIQLIYLVHNAAVFPTAAMIQLLTTYVNFFKDQIIDELVKSRHSRVGGNPESV